MNDLKIFNNPEFGQVRTVIQDGKTLFVGNDVAKALGYVETAKAVRTHCKGVSDMDIPTAGGMQTVKVISEGDIYRLTMKSQLPSAERFETWVCDVILPSIRQNGGYVLNQEVMTPEQIVANALIVANNIISNKDKQIAELKPKAEFFDAVADSRSAIEIGNVAKVLGFKGYGRNNLFEFLRCRGILMNNNQPYQKYIDAGYFRVIEQKYAKPDGEICISFKTLVYQKGVNFIRKMLEKDVA